MKQWIWIFIVLLLVVLGALVLVMEQAQEDERSERPSPTSSKDSSMQDTTQQDGNFSISSSAFEHTQNIPSKYTCDGEDMSPPLTITSTYEDIESLVLIMDDPDAPAGTWDHWVVFNIPPTSFELPEGTEPKGVAGVNSWERTGYGGPCPPDGEHRYSFRLYGVAEMLDLSEGSTKTQVEETMEGKVVRQAELMGRYNRQ